MANDQLATVILKLITDNKEFAEGLKNALQLTAITSTQMKDLMEFKIKAPDFSALDLTVETNQKKISELVKSQSEQTAASRDEGAAADEAGAKIKGHGELVDTGAKSIQQFRSEQRLQNFVVREGSQALLGLTTAVGFLTLGNQDADSTTKKVQTSMLAGITAANGMEFAMFSLGQASKNMGGPLGNILQKISGMGGTVSVVVGVVAGLVSMFSQARSEAMTAASQGIDRFVESLRKLSESGQQDVVKRLGNDLKALEKQQEDLTKKIIEARRGTIPLTPEMGMPDEANDAVLQGLLKQAAALKLRSDILEDLIEKTKKMIELQKIEAPIQEDQRQANLKSGADLIRVQQQIDDLLKQREKATGSGLVEINGQIAAKEKERGQYLMTNQDWDEKKVRILATERDLGFASTEELRKQLEYTVKNATDTERKLAAQKQLNELAKAETELAKQRLEAQQKGYDEEWVAFQKLNEMTRKSSIDAIENKFDREKALENERHKKALDDIHDAGVLANDLQATQAATDAENALHRRNELDLEMSKRLDQFDIEQTIRGEGLAADIADVNQKYDEAERRAREVYANDVRLTEILAGLKKARERDIMNATINGAKNEVEKVSSLLGNLVTIASGMHADGFVNDIQQALQYMQMIQAIMETIQTVSSFFSLFGLQGGGIIGAASGFIVPGSGSGDKIPILTEPGEAVINRNAVRAMGGPMGVVRVNQMWPRFATGGPLGMWGVTPEMIAGAQQLPILVGQVARFVIDNQGFNKPNFDALIDEVRRVGEKVERLEKVTAEKVPFPDKVGVDLSNGQMFLRKEQPALQKFINKKQVPKS